MQKKMIQDIYVVKKSIRMIKKSDVSDGFYVEIKKPKVIENNIDDREELVNKFPIKNDTSEDNNDEYFEQTKHVTKDSLIMLWVICIASLATLLFLLSSTFASATLNITPKNENVTLNNTYTITTASTTNSLQYEIMTIKNDLTKNLETDGE